MIDLSTVLKAIQSGFQRASNFLPFRDLEDFIKKNMASSDGLYSETFYKEFEDKLSCQNPIVFYFSSYFCSHLIARIKDNISFLIYDLPLLEKSDCSDCIAKDNVIAKTREKAKQDLLDLLRSCYFRVFCLKWSTIIFCAIVFSCLILIRN